MSSASASSLLDFNVSLEKLASALGDAASAPPTRWPSSDGHQPSSSEQKNMTSSTLGNRLRATSNLGGSGDRHNSNTKQKKPTFVEPKTTESAVPTVESIKNRLLTSARGLKIVRSMHANPMGSDGTDASTATTATAPAVENYAHCRELLYNRILSQDVLVPLRKLINKALLDESIAGQDEAYKLLLELADPVLWQWSMRMASIAAIHERSQRAAFLLPMFTCSTGQQTDATGSVVALYFALLDALLFCRQQPDLQRFHKELSSAICKIVYMATDVFCPVLESLINSNGQTNRATGGNSMSVLGIAAAELMFGRACDMQHHATLMQNATHNSITSALQELYQRSAALRSSTWTVLHKMVKDTFDAFAATDFCFQKWTAHEPFFQKAPCATHSVSMMLLYLRTRLLAPFEQLCESDAVDCLGEEEEEEEYKDDEAQQKQFQQRGRRRSSLTAEDCVDAKVASSSGALKSTFLRGPLLLQITLAWRDTMAALKCSAARIGQLHHDAHHFVQCVKDLASTESWTPSVQSLDAALADILAIAHVRCTTIGQVHEIIEKKRQMRKLQSMRGGNNASNASNSEQQQAPSEARALEEVLRSGTVASRLTASRCPLQHLVSSSERPPPLSTDGCPRGTLEGADISELLYSQDPVMISEGAFAAPANVPTPASLVDPTNGGARSKESVLAGRSSDFVTQQRVFQEQLAQRWEMWDLYPQLEEDDDIGQQEAMKRALRKVGESRAKEEERLRPSPKAEVPL